MNEFIVPYNVFIDKEWILANDKFSELGDDLHARLKKAKEVAIAERADKNMQLIIVDHDYNANCFLIFSYNFLMDITNGNLKIHAQNKQAIGILIGKNGKNVNSIKNRINLKLSDFNGLEESGFPKRHIRNFKIIDIEKLGDKK